MEAPLYMYFRCFCYAYGMARTHAVDHNVTMFPEFFFLVGLLEWAYTVIESISGGGGDVDK